jgi:hypothetical protein
MAAQWGAVLFLAVAIRRDGVGMSTFRRPRARHLRWLGAMRSRRPLSQEGVSALEMLSARRLAKQTRTFARFLDVMLFGGL